MSNLPKSPFLASLARRAAREGHSSHDTVNGAFGAHPCSRRVSRLADMLSSCVFSKPRGRESAPSKRVVNNSVSGGPQAAHDLTAGLAIRRKPRGQNGATAETYAKVGDSTRQQNEVQGRRPPIQTKCMIRHPRRLGTGAIRCAPDVVVDEIPARTSRPKATSLMDECSPSSRQWRTMFQCWRKS